MEALNLPLINAIFNGIAVIFLLSGYILIKKGREKEHRYAMIGALAASTFFMIGYITYHYTAKVTEFPREYPIARRIYFAILFPHIVLAVINLPLVICLVMAAIRGNFKLHKRFARFTWPIWMYVSVTGVLIYLMVHQWYPASSVESKKPVKSVPLILKEKVNSGTVFFSPAAQSIHVEAGIESVTAIIQVSNTGEKPVVINKLESGCSCLSVSMKNRRIEPGKVETISGVFSTEKLSGEAEKSITVGTDQEGERDVFLTVNLNIDPLYTITENMTSWKIGEKPTAKVITFQVARDKPIKITKASSSRDEMSCDIRMIEEGRRYELLLKPSSTSSHLLGFVRIETNCELEHHARPLAYFSVQ